MYYQQRTVLWYPYSTVLVQYCSTPTDELSEVSASLLVGTVRSVLDRSLLGTSSYTYCTYKGLQ